MNNEITHEIPSMNDHLLVNDFWSTGQFDHFLGVDNIKIHYAYFQNKEHEKSLIIVPGRAESYQKYQELSYQLFNDGYNLFLLDHRGQGDSERLLSNPHKGHVESFQDYADDLNAFINQVVIPHCLPNSKPYLLAHSMGCAISCLALATSSHLIQAAVFSSPMFAINTGRLPAWLARFLVQAMAISEGIHSQESRYFIGQKNHQFKTFKQNKLTHSKTRFEHFNTLYQQQSQLKLGGVTTKWLQEALTVEKKILALLKKITTPIQVLQAGADTIVDNTAQLRFCQRLHVLHPASCPNGSPVVIEEAFHELLFEQDKYRQIAITAALAWFEQHNN